MIKANKLFFLKTKIFTYRPKGDRTPLHFCISSIPKGSASQHASSFNSRISAIAQLGLNAIVIRNIVHEEKAAPEILGTAFVLKLMASSVTIVLISIAIWTFDTNPDVRWMTLIIAFSLVLTGCQGTGNGLGLHQAPPIYITIEVQSRV
jgi:hypothetical protein